MNRSKLLTIITDTIGLLSNPRFIAPCVAGSFMLIVGTVIGVQYLFNMAAVLFALPLAGYMMAWLSLKGLRVRRKPIPNVVEGQPLNAAFEVSGSGFSPRLRIKLTEMLPEHITGESAEGIEVAMCSVDSPVIDYTIHTSKRGIYQLGPVFISSKDPIGIFECRKKAGLMQELVVYPRPEPVWLKMLSSESSFRHDESRNSSRKGDSFDIYGLRDYVAGDDIRRIHWKTTARKGSLVVTEQEFGTGNRVTVAVETKKGSEVFAESGSSLDIAVRAARFVIESAQSAGMFPRLVLASRGVMEMSEDYDQMLYSLARAKADSDLSLGMVLESIDIASDQSLVIITPEIDELLMEQISRLSGQNVPLSVVLVSDNAYRGPRTGPGLTGVEVTTVMGRML